jgi:hypothetical protein
MSVHARLHTLAGLFASTLLVSASAAHAEHVMLARQVDVPSLLAAFEAADPTSDWVAVPVQSARGFGEGPALSLDLTCGAYSATLFDSAPLKRTPFASAIDGSIVVYGIDPDEIDYSGDLENTGIDPDVIDYSGAQANTGIDPDIINIACTPEDDGSVEAASVRFPYPLDAMDSIYLADSAQGIYVLHNRTGGSDFK